jgi:hypothetical protein
MVYWRRNYAVHWTGTWLPLGLGLMWHSASGACILYIYICIYMHIHQNTIINKHIHVYTHYIRTYTWLSEYALLYTIIYVHIHTYTLYDADFGWSWFAKTWSWYPFKFIPWLSIISYIQGLIYLSRQSPFLCCYMLVPEVCPLLHWKHAFSLTNPMNTGCLGLWHMHTGDKLRWKQTQSLVPGRDATYGIHSPPRWLPQALNVCIYMYMYVYICICMYLNVYVCIYMYLYVY